MRRTKRIGLLTLLVSISLVTVAAQPAVADEPDREEVQEQLEEVQKDLEVSSKVIKLMSWGALLRGYTNGNKLLTTAGSTARKVGTNAGRTADGIADLIDAYEDEADDEAEELGEELLDEVTDILNLKGELGKLRRKVKGLEFGVVEDGKDTQISLDMLLDEPKKAKKRAKLYASRVESNIDKLKRTQAYLEELERRANAADEVLFTLQEALEDVAPYSGPFANALYMKWFEMDDLISAVRQVRNAAQDRMKKLEPVLKEEERRLRCYRSNLKTFFDIDV